MGGEMKSSKEEKVLISTLTAERLLEASERLVREDEYAPLQVSVFNASPIMNPTGHPGFYIFDLAGLKAKLAECERYLAGGIEMLRQLWKAIEHSEKVRGKDPERTIESIDNMQDEKIAETVIYTQVRYKEVKKLRKQVSEIESKQATIEHNKRLYQGAVKRARQGKNGVMEISQVDGMPVGEDGMITKLNMHIDAYLEECRVRRNKHAA